MLLTKPLASFLHANLSPPAHTLLLISPSGRLLSSASSHPASTLRAQATLAASLWEIYAPLAQRGVIRDSLPTPTAGPQDEGESDEIWTKDKLGSILLTLEFGTIIVRALACELLFVAIGATSPNTKTSTAAHTLAADAKTGEYLAAASPAGSSTGLHPLSNGASVGLESSAASVDGSVAGSTNAAGGSVRLLRRQAEELGKWLDGELEGFVLAVPL